MSSIPEMHPPVDAGVEEDALASKAESVHAWRAEQLRRLGLPDAVTEAFADAVDWHAVAALVARGCPPRLALEIVR